MGYVKPNAIMNAAQLFIMGFVQRPRITLVEVPGRSFPFSLTSSRRSTSGKSSRASRRNSSAASSSLGGRGGIGRGGGATCLGPAPNVLPQLSHSLALLGNVA